MNEELKIELGVNEWLELIKEDKNLNGAYISICQYIYLIERKNQELQKKLEKCVSVSEESKTIRRMNKRIEKLKNKLTVYKNVILANDDIPTLEDLLNKPINPDLSNWSVCDIQYIKGYLYLLSLKEQDLKKQLKNLRSRYKNKLNKMLSEGIEPDFEEFYLAEIECKANDYDKSLNQQKRFIKYLEDENTKFDIKANGMGASSERDELITKARAYREILTKYKEIMRISDEK